MQHEHNDIILENVVPTKDQIEELYSQLKQRKHTISHKSIPIYSDHIKFVNNNPYRAWFIVKQKKNIIGNIYVNFDNSIGLNCSKDLQEFQIKNILQKLSHKLKPLEEIPSVRFKSYFLNVSSTNTELQKKLTNLGLKESQRSFIFTES